MIANSIESVATIWNMVAWKYANIVLMCVTFSTIHIITPNMQGIRRNNTMESISFLLFHLTDGGYLVDVGSIAVSAVLWQIVLNNCVPFKYILRYNLMHMKSCMPRYFPVRFASGAAFGSVSYVYHQHARVLRSFQHPNSWHYLLACKIIVRSFILEIWNIWNFWLPSN